MKILILKGLPASGKSTFAKELVEKSDGLWKRSNKDELRLMLDGGQWSKANEKFVIKVRNSIILEALDNGKNVVVDDTNLDPCHEADIRALVEKFIKLKWKEVDIEVKMFDTPLLECIDRDRKRDGKAKVGEKVIRDMYNRYLRKEIQPVTFDSALPMLDICDLDGTLALHNGRSPYDAAKCETDLLNEPVAAMLRANMHYGHEVIFLSGREDIYREQTQRWLDKHGFGGIRLLMRPAGDKRNDAIVKQELYEAHIKGRYNVLAVIDDRARVCRMWHSLGLPLYRVGDPDAEF